MNWMEMVAAAKAGITTAVGGWERSVYRETRLSPRAVNEAISSILGPVARQRIEAEFEKRAGPVTGQTAAKAAAVAKDILRGIANDATVKAKELVAAWRSAERVPGATRSWSAGMRAVGYDPSVVYCPWAVTGQRRDPTIMARG